MTQKEFREKKAAIVASMANLEGDALREKEQELKNLREEFADETAMMQRSSVEQKSEKTLVSQVREAMSGNNKTFSVNAGVEMRENEIVKNAHTTETEMQGLLEPLYANSILSQVGARFFTGLPQGDIQIPIMGKGSVGWAGEVSAASAAGETFTHVTLVPKRLTAYVDISKAFILADTVGAEQAIKRDLVNAIKDKLEATVFGYGALSSTAPAGMFNGNNLSDANSFAKVCGIEATLEEANVQNIKYVLSPKAKADLRAMAKSSKNTQLVLEGGAVDGVPAICSSNVIDASGSTKGAYIVGDWSNLAVGVWGNIEITVDEYSQAVNGCVRLVVNCYCDAKVLRSGAFAYGDTRHA